MFLLPYFGQIAFQGMKSIVKGWSSQKGKQKGKTIQKNVPNTQQLIIPFQIHNDQKLLKQFMTDVWKSQLKNNVKYKIKMEDPQQVEFIKIPNSIKKNTQKHQQILDQVNKLKQKSSKKVKIAYI